VAIVVEAAGQHSVVGSIRPSAVNEVGGFRLFDGSAATDFLASLTP
jgi:hypothetical protein